MQVAKKYRLWYNKKNDPRSEEIMTDRILNITNGDVFNDHFLSQNGGVAVPFREAMMDGAADIEIYSHEFIMLRTAELNVGVEEYMTKALVREELLSDYSALCLWFGKDTFCQMNLLTLLAYLEQIEYSGNVTLNYIDDETFEVLDSNIAVELGIYKKLYEDILISKILPKRVGVLCPDAIELYFDYHSNDGKLAHIVRDNADMSEMELLCLLLESSKQYGLSDIQAQKLINKYRR